MKALWAGHYRSIVAMLYATSSKSLLPSFLLSFFLVFLPSFILSLSPLFYLVPYLLVWIHLSFFCCVFRLFFPYLLIGRVGESLVLYKNDLDVLDLGFLNGKRRAANAEYSNHVASCLSFLWQDPLLAMTSSFFLHNSLLMLTSSIPPFSAMRSNITRAKRNVVSLRLCKQ